jgi:c-di-GMP-binding flagellar brake protein YcgR
MSEDLLSLHIGSVLQLQLTPDTDAPRYQVRLIGYLPGGSVIVSAPESAGKLVFLRAGQNFKVRMLRGDSVLGFTAPIVMVQSKPYPHLHLACPKEVDRIVVRNARRVMSDIWGTARNMEAVEGADPISVELIDLSMTGARLVAEEPLGEHGDVLQLRFQILVAGKPETITTLGTIRNTGERQNTAGLEQFTYGIEFTSTNRYQQVLLHGWVLERMTAEDSPAKGRTA